MNVLWFMNICLSCIKKELNHIFRELLLSYRRKPKSIYTYCVDVTLRPIVYIYYLRTSL